MRIALAVVSLAAVVALRATSEAPEGIPLILVQQGVNHYEVDDVPVFVQRQGSLLTVFLGRSTRSGEALVYCPNEDAFVAPLEGSLWNAQGQWVAGDAPRDLDTVAFDIDRDLVLHVDATKVTRAKGRSDGAVSGEAGAAYERFRAGDTNAGFCLNPVPAPEQTPTPSPS